MLRISDYCVPNPKHGICISLSKAQRTSWKRSKTILDTSDGEGCSTLSSELDMAIVTYSSCGWVYKSGPVNIQSCMGGVSRGSWVPTPLPMPMLNTLFKLKRSQNENKSKTWMWEGTGREGRIDEGKKGLRQGGVSMIRMYYINYDIVK